MNLFDILGYTSLRKYSRSSKTNVGEYALVNVSISYKLTANPGSYSITGNNATVNKTSVLSAASGAYLLTGNDAEIVYTPVEPTLFVPTKGGIPKAKTHVKKNEHDDVAAIVKREFDILDGTYQPEVIEQVKEVFIPKINQVDLNEYDIAIKQVNALLLQAKNEAAKYEAKLIQDELDDEEAILMLL